MIAYLLILFHALSFSFDTSTNIKECATALETGRLPENNDWINPSYEQWYQNAFNTFTKRILYSFFSISPACFDLQKAKQLFTDLIIERQTKNSSWTDFTEIVVKSDQNYYLIGGLFGDFHGLQKILQELQQRSVIDENLLLQGNNNLVFMGNVIDYSPYSFETLLIVASIMKKNPATCFYIRAQHEHKQTWYSFTFKHQLLAFDHLSPWKKQESWVSLMSTFFDTLTQGIIFKTPENNDSIIISSQNEALKDNPHSLLLLKTPDDFFSIRSEKINGFEGFEKGIPTWSLLSSTNAILQNYFSLRLPHFAKLAINTNLSSSTLIYFKANETTNTFDELQTISAGLVQRAITFGSTMDSSKGVSFQGTAIKQGVELSFNRQNLTSAVHDHYFQFISLDDQYNPSIARKQAQILLDDYKINQLLCSIGSPTIEAYIDLIKNKQLYLFFPITGADFLRNGELEALIHFRVSYKTEVQALLKKIIKEENKKNIVFFYQDDAFGTGALTAAQEFLKDYPDINLTLLAYSANSTQFDNLIEQLAEKEYDALGFFATAFATQEFIRQLGIEKLVNKKMFGLSDLSELSFQRFLKDQGLTCLVAYVVPPLDSNLGIIQEYRSLMQSDDSDNRPYVLEGFIAAEIIVDAIKKMSTEQTPQNLMHYLETYKDYDFKGLKLHFNPLTRELNSTVWLYDGQNFTENHEII
jgi:ABC-type branched-subunit amino acid transport system substrate-binding protein